jgi:hypothetical protein
MVRFGQSLDKLANETERIVAAAWPLAGAFARCGQSRKTTRPTITRRQVAAFGVVHSDNGASHLGHTAHLVWGI